MAPTDKVFETIEVKIDPDLHFGEIDPVDENDEFAWAYLDTALRLIEKVASKVTGKKVDARGHNQAAYHVFQAAQALVEDAR